MAAFAITDKPAPPATLLARIAAVLQLAQLVLVVLVIGTLPAIRGQLGKALGGRSETTSRDGAKSSSDGSLALLLDVFAWRDAIWGNAMAKILAQTDVEQHEVKKQMLSHAHGRVLEIGAGSGETVKYYDQNKIKELYALEPFPAAIPHLNKAIASRGSDFSAKSQVVVAGIEDVATLSSRGITSGSLDSLVVVRCMCSIPGGPQAHLRRCVDLLRPGGTIIMIEHTLQTGDHLSQQLQRISNPPWRFMANGCELTRDSLGVLLSLQCWDDVVVRRPVGESTASLLPHIFVTATKKGA